MLDDTTDRTAVEKQMKKRIMIVDDDPGILRAVKALLEIEGLGVITVDNGQDCIAELGKGFRGVILMDVDMPVMDGWDTIREMVNRRCIEGNIISMLTGQDTPDRKMEGLQEYVIDYITKPFDPDELMAAIKGYLEHLE